MIAARTLEEGQAWLEGRLNVPLQPGGQHAAFGTHNALLSLGNAYLEVIAIDPHASAPARPRWFALDTPGMHERLAAGPALIHWVAAVSEPLPHGLELARGTNRWQLTVPENGSLPMGGVSPSLIYWHTPPPATVLPDAGVRLITLRLGTPEPDRLRNTLNALHFTGEVEVYEAPQVELGVQLRTQDGLVEL